MRQHGMGKIELIFDWIRAMRENHSRTRCGGAAPMHSNDSVRVRLSSFMPKTGHEESGRYVCCLMRALYEDGCRNVSLAGAYGSGKSSILADFTEMALASGHKVVYVNLSTFNLVESPGILGCSTGEGSSPFLSCSDDVSHPLSSGSVTSFLEQEILSQLIYQGSPEKAIHSVFNGVHVPSRLRYMKTIIALMFSALSLALIVSHKMFPDLSPLWFAASTLSQLFSSEVDAMAALILWGSIVICLLSTIFCLYQMRVGVRTVATAGSSIAFEVETKSYFNKYRDELIYLFEENEFDTVIFEDIDRFGDVGIFSALRNLNFILNSAPRISGSRTVHFVYAVREGLFDSLDMQDGFSASGSEKMKLFDIIIPVTPFLSRANAYDHMIELFREELESIDTEERKDFCSVVRLVAGELVDKRLMVGIHNDYIMICDGIGPFNEMGITRLGLTRSGALAIAVYKNLYAADYEQIRLGKGKLFELLDIMGSIIFDCINDSADTGCSSALRQMDFCDLMKGGASGEKGHAFQEEVKRRYASGVIYDLIENGFLRKDFFLYPCLYPPTLSPSVIDFMTNGVMRGKQDIGRPLGDADCIELCNRNAPSTFARPSCFNIDLLIWALGNCGYVEYAISMAEGACRLNSGSGRLLLARTFERIGDDPLTIGPLIRVVMNEISGAFEYLYDFYGQGKRFGGLSAIESIIIKEFSPDINYDHLELSKRWVKTMLGEIECRNLYLLPRQRERLADFIIDNGIRVERLRILGDDLARRLIRTGSYEITQGNLMYATGSLDIPSIDRLFDEYHEVFIRILNDLTSIEEYIVLRSRNPMGSQSVMSSYNSFFLCGLASEMYQWNDSNDARKAIEKIVDCSPNLPPLFNASSVIERPLKRGYLSFVSSFLQSLFRRRLIVENIGNAVTLGNYYIREAFEGADQLFLDFIGDGQSFDLNDEIRVDDNRLDFFILALLKAPTMDDEKIISIVESLFLHYGVAFPVVLHPAYIPVSRDSIVRRLIEEGFAKDGL